MKRYLLMLLLLLSAIFPVAAQDEETVLVPFENEMFGITGVVPEGWQETNPGVYARAATPEDFVLVIAQAAPISKESLASTLVQQFSQFGMEALPEPSDQIETMNYTWDDYTFTLEEAGTTVEVSLALAQGEGQAVMVMLQSPPEEHEALRESVYMPMLEALAPLAGPEVTEEAVPYIQEEVTFSHEEATLAGTLTLPEGEGPHPAVILISGSGGQDRDGTLSGFRIFQQIADHLTRNGIAVLRYDDRGVGSSTGDIATATSEDFAVDTSAAVDYLLTRDDINSDEIGLLGHSEGGMVAPLTITMNDNVAFFISMAGPAVSGDAFLREQARLIGETGDYTQEQAVTFVESQLALLDAIAAEDVEGVREAMMAQFETFTPEQQAAYGSAEVYAEQAEALLNNPWRRFLLAYDPAEDLDAIEVPVLAVYGSLDVQVDDEQNAPVMEEVLADNPDATVVVIEGANHLFQEAETGGLNEYEALDPVLMPEFLETITNWLLERVTVTRE